MTHVRNIPYRVKGRHIVPPPSRNGETPYLSVLLHDPSFIRPLRAAFENSAERTGVLVWNPPTEKDR
ncbi:MAG: hypothetical protein B7X53_01125 [Hyphomonas sp. 34-62-18]|nr:MAG: hypothetical protein B7X53_01125 [Hyphomonas sp. 34-62-18]